MKKKNSLLIIAVFAIITVNFTLLKVNNDVNLKLSSLLSTATAYAEGGVKAIPGTCNCYYGGVKDINYFCGSRVTCTPHPLGESCTAGSCSSGCWCVY